MLEIKKNQNILVLGGFCVGKTTFVKELLKSSDLNAFSDLFIISFDEYIKDIAKNRADNIGLKNNEPLAMCQYLVDDNNVKTHEFIHTLLTTANKAKELNKSLLCIFDSLDIIKNCFATEKAFYQYLDILKELGVTVIATGIISVSINDRKHFDKIKILERKSIFKRFFEKFLKS
tara:strand:+ start:2917 stop:3441 length:525 start_codon:yes stop_codon:yes gene_type:complete